MGRTDGMITRICPAHPAAPAHPADLRGCRNRWINVNGQKTVRYNTNAMSFWRRHRDGRSVLGADEAPATLRPFDELTVVPNNVEGRHAQGSPHRGSGVGNSGSGSEPRFRWSG